MISTLRRVLGGHAVGGELGVAASLRSVPADGPLWVTLSAEQPHPIDLRWVDTLVASARPHLMVRPEDDLLILVPNTPLKLNRTAVRLLHAMVHDGLGIADVLAREGDSPRRRAFVHEFFTISRRGSRAGSARATAAARSSRSRSRPTSAGTPCSPRSRSRTAATSRAASATQVAAPPGCPPAGARTA